jgi:hypothetical protein
MLNSSILCLCLYKIDLIFTLSENWWPPKLTITRAMEAESTNLVRQCPWFQYFRSFPIISNGAMMAGLPCNGRTDETSLLHRRICINFHDLSPIPHLPIQLVSRPHYDLGKDDQANNFHCGI